MPDDHHSHYADDLIARVLSQTGRIALLGASANPARPSHSVMRFLLAQGYDVVPVNPGMAGQQLLGQTVHASLADIDGAIDLVDVFRNSEAVPGIVEEVLALPQLPQFIWMQLGVYDVAAATRAEAAGLTVIMNRCPAIEIPRLQRAGIFVKPATEKPNRNVL